MNFKQNRGLDKLFTIILLFTLHFFFFLFPTGGNFQNYNNFYLGKDNRVQCTWRVVFSSGASDKSDLLAGAFLGPDLIFLYKSRNLSRDLHLAHNFNQTLFHLARTFNQTLF